MMRNLVFLSVVACGGGSISVSDTDTDTDPEAVEAQDYAKKGSFAVNFETGSTRVGDCDMSWTRYSGATEVSGATVILSHGFLRSQDNTAGWGEHLASWGLDVITVNLCHARITDTDHEANGEELGELPTKLVLEQWIYVGHSAGGLASVLAAAENPPVAAFTLDGVDADGLGAAALKDVTIPVGGLVGDSSRCNDQNNANGWFAQDSALRVDGATHCDFEAPTDGGCTAICGGSGGEDTIGTIRGLTTAWLLWRGGVDPAGEQWWTPGNAWFDGLDGVSFL